jgi:predicted RNA-binding Zn-ribbon protein involved in translation (DUF1610 family)
MSSCPNCGGELVVFVGIVKSTRKWVKLTACVACQYRGEVR